MAYVDTAETLKANRAFIRRTMNAPLLDGEKELRLARAWRDRKDRRALDELTSSYLRLCVAVAARFRNYGLPFGDLIQEGVVGLMQAAERFEPEREVRFSTYATWWIRAAIQDYVLKNWSIVRLTSTAAQKSLFFNLRRLRALIENRPGHSLSREGAEEIAKRLKVNVRDVEDMDVRLSLGDRSLNAAPAEQSDQEWQDLLADDRPLPDQIVLEQRDSAARARSIARAMTHLSERETVIIKERHLTDDTVTLEQLGQRLGISKERVRQVEANALAKLKRSLESQFGEGQAPRLLM